MTSQQWRQAAERPEELDVFKAQLADKLDQAAGAWGGETGAWCPRGSDGRRSESGGRFARAENDRVENHRESSYGAAI